VGAGGGGEGLITGSAGLDADYLPSPGSRALDAALVNAETPAVDFEGRARGARPDLGARERDGAPAAACP
jgi:hypothetical protein